MGQKKRILVVDDELSIVKTVSNVLNLEGYEVAVASDGMKALVAMKANKPDLLILDLGMPVMSGYDLCQTLALDDDLKDIPIVILTSHDQDKAIHLGIYMDVEYLHKSCTPKELVSKVNKIIVCRG
ncbi:MAG: response regulator [Candidatus Omnitrophica bacterium]|nr:response regulator [Candidatus Omnitrophota bacterium]